MSDLLPCPFCGGEGYIQGSEREGFFASCRDCYVCIGEAYDRSAMPEHMFRNEEAATEAWNRRTDSPKAQMRGSDRLTQFLYRLLRDHGLEYLEQHIGETCHSPAIYSLPDLAASARHLSAALLPAVEVGVASKSIGIIREAVTALRGHGCHYSLSNDLEAVATGLEVPQGQLIREPKRPAFNVADIKFGECHQCGVRGNLASLEDGMLICGGCADANHLADWKNYARSLAKSLATGPDGWVSHAGGRMPVPMDTMVKVRFRNHDAVKDEFTSDTGRASDWSWHQDGKPDDIVSYLVCQPTHPPEEAWVTELREILQNTEQLLTLMDRHTGDAKVEFRSIRIPKRLIQTIERLQTPSPQTKMRGMEEPNVAYVGDNTLLIRAIKGMLAIVSDSSGVSGYHHDRVTAWSEFPEVAAAREALSANVQQHSRTPQ